MQQYIDPKFNIITIDVPDVISTSNIEPIVPNASERDNAYVSAGKLFSGGGDGGFFMDF